MTRAKSITKSIKEKSKPLILARDYPDGQKPFCMICTQEFLDDDFEYQLNYEHINGNHEENELWNLWFAHFRCNQIKKKIQQRQKSKPASLSKNELHLIRKFNQAIQKNKVWQESADFEKFEKKRKLEKLASSSEDSVFIDISYVLETVTLEVLAEYLQTPKSEYPAKELAEIIASRTQSKIQAGSIQSAMNHILLHTTSESRYQKYKKGVSWYVSQRVSLN